jgi:hypothetical protein
LEKRKAGPTVTNLRITKSQLSGKQFCFEEPVTTALRVNGTYPASSDPKNVQIKEIPF